MSLGLAPFLVKERCVKCQCIEPSSGFLPARASGHQPGQETGNVLAA